MTNNTNDADKDKMGTEDPVARKARLEAEKAREDALKLSEDKDKKSLNNEQK